ncbi:MAG: hypothetical protein JXA77_09755 [Bacteroidales bacterium]|nr:hypothetical protein [Bacteroidales bacterium]MBN2821429.1 hypothetical protein [Bacteroidales bacterium]
MDLKFSANELQQFRNNEQIVRETAEQVIKDFYLFGLDVNFPENIHWAYDELYHQLLAHIDRMLSLDDKKLLALLYQIDVSEKKIQVESQNQPEKSLAVVVTELILDRELKKVLTRLYFKNLTDK